MCFNFYLYSRKKCKPNANYDYQIQIKLPNFGPKQGFKNSE